MGAHPGCRTFVIVQRKGGDAQIRGAAADIDAGDPERRVGAVIGPVPARKPEEVVRVAMKFVHHFVVQVDKLGAAGFIPAAARLRALPVVPPF